MQGSRMNSSRCSSSLQWGDDRFWAALSQSAYDLFGAAAQFGIFATMIISTLLGFDLKTAASIGIIGAADGPTAIYVATKFAREYLAPISVAAYSYMSLVPLIQPPVIRLLTTKEERRIHMPLHEKQSPQWLKVLFPILVTMTAGFVAPISVPLVGS